MIMLTTREIILGAQEARTLDDSSDWVKRLHRAGEKMKDAFLEVEDKGGKGKDSAHKLVRLVEQTNVDPKMAKSRKSVAADGLARKKAAAGPEASGLTRRTSTMV